MKVVNRDVVDLIRWQTWDEIHSSVDRRAWDQIRISVWDEQVRDQVSVQVQDTVKGRIFDEMISSVNTPPWRRALTRVQSRVWHFMRLR